MHAQRLDRLTRQSANGISRRGSVMTLGGAALAALVRPAAAKKRKASCGKRARKKASGACQRQVDACEASFIEFELPERIPCCAPLATCDFAEFFACLPD